MIFSNSAIIFSRSAGLVAFCDEVENRCPANAELHVLSAHINDPEFTETALAVFDGWLEDGTIRTT